jgi:hypothetical protein
MGAPPVKKKTGETAHQMMKASDFNYNISFLAQNAL